MISCGLLFFCLIIMTTSQLVRSNQCVAPSPCTCSYSEIFCNNKQFTTVPALIGFSNTTYSLHLQNNPNLVITDDSFANITLDYLNLDYSTNISISIHAFKTQTNSLRELHMSAAHLHRVPEALRDLHVLRKLVMSDNNIQHWDLMLMETLAVSLSTLDISNDRVTSWPTWIRHMSDLNRLDISKNPLRVIPHNAFQGFEWRLTYLNIEDTGITDIPTALQTLHKLVELHVGGSTLSDSSFYETWLPSHSSGLATLYIYNTNITTLPIGLREGRSLRSFYIDNSLIKHIDEDLMPPSLTLFHLTHNLLTHIHSGLCSSSLTNLLLDSNIIESVEKNDLYDCENLNYFSATLNNIGYISPTAFDRLTQLKTLYLDYNTMKQIPTALQHLHSLSSLYLNSNPLECTCQDLWFPQWRENASSLYIVGKCLNLDIELENFNPSCS